MAASFIHELHVSGMSCASCVAKIEKALLGVPGVRSASVSLMTHSARIEGQVAESRLVKAIEKLGYKVEESGLQAREDGPTLTLGISAMGLAVPVMILGMGFHDWKWNVQIQMILTLAILVMAWPHILRRAVMAARGKQATMDTLVTLGTVASLVLSVVNLIRGGHHLYFETASVICSVVMLGRALENRQKKSAKSSMDSLLAMQVSQVRVQRDGKESMVDLQSLRLGDLAMCRPGELVPVDGYVRRGLSTVDESLLTGESMPVEKSAGARMFAGTKNIDGVLFIEMDTLPEKTMLQQIGELLFQAQSFKPPVQKLVDRVSGIFVSIVLGIAAVTFIVWGFGAGDWTKGILCAVGILVVACPCALGLATPVAMIVASGQAAKRGMLVRNLSALEMGERVSRIIFDKTGTITEGIPQVVHIDNQSQHSDRVFFQLIASAEKHSEHPVGKMLVDEATHRRAISLIEPDEFRSTPGQGVEAKVSGHKVIVGKFDFLKAKGVGELEQGRWKEVAGSVYVALDGVFAGIIVLADPIKPTAARALALLRKAGIPMEILSGDHESIARDVARTLGIDQVTANAKPADKLQRVKDFQKKKEVVAFAGDGVNDAPVMAQADLSFAMGQGTAVAIHSAHVTILRGDLMKILSFLQLSRQTMTIVRQNLIWAFAYNILAIPLAAGGVIQPTLAAAAMAFSSIAVVSNSLRLRN